MIHIWCQCMMPTLELRLQVMTHAYAERIVFEGNKARGQKTFVGRWFWSLYKLICEDSYNLMISCNPIMEPPWLMKPPQSSQRTHTWTSTYIYIYILIYIYMYMIWSYMYYVCVYMYIYIYNIHLYIWSGCFSNADPRSGSYHRDQAIGVEVSIAKSPKALNSFHLEMFIDFPIFFCFNAIYALKW